MKKIYKGLFVLINTSFFFSNASAQGTWIKETNIENPNVTGVYAPNADVVDNNAYIAFGANQDQNNNVTLSKSIYEYNTSTKTWTTKKVFPGSYGRYGVVSFALNDTIYYVTGSKDNAYLTEFWAYSVKGDSWKQKTNFPGSARIHATGFVIGNKGYVYGGSDGNTALNDLWEFNANTGIWTKKTSPPTSARVGAVAFVIKDQAYITAGKTLSGTYFNDTWKYNPTTDTWAQKATRTGINSATQSGIAFTINGIGYFGQGVNIHSYSQAIFAYNPVSDSWTSATSFPGKARFMSVAFVINDEAFVGLGASYWSPPVYEKDIWKFTPDDLTTSSEDEVLANNKLSISPNPCSDIISVKSSFSIKNGSITITSIDGSTIIKETNLQGETFNILTSSLEKGLYLISLMENGELVERIKFVKE